MYMGARPLLTDDRQCLLIQPAHTYNLQTYQSAHPVTFSGPAGLLLTSELTHKLIKLPSDALQGRLI